MTGRPDESVGYGMLFNILHIEHPVELHREASRVLTPGVVAGIVHWRSDIPRRAVDANSPVRPTVPGLGRADEAQDS